jgi:hypothetical protein
MSCVKPHKRRVKQSKKYAESRCIPQNSGGNADFRQLFQAIIPSGSIFSQDAKRPSGDSASYAAVLPKPSFCNSATASIRYSGRAPCRKIRPKSSLKTIRLFCGGIFSGKSSKMGTSEIVAGERTFDAAGVEIGGIIGTTVDFSGILLADFFSGFFSSPEKSDLIAKPATVTNNNGGATLAII